MKLSRANIMADTHFLTIDGYQTTVGLQKQFGGYFHYLKIEFFREPCIKGKGTSKDKLISSDERLSVIFRNLKPGILTFSEQTLVGELENSFFEKFGVCIQVFRKSGNVWLETTSTDDWSLEQQNEEGRSLARHFKIEKEYPNDHDIY